MKFEDVEIGGKDVGTPHILLLGNDKERAASLIGQARALLGNLKMRMQLAGIQSLQDRLDLPTEKLEIKADSSTKNLIRNAVIEVHSVLGFLDRITIYATLDIVDSGGDVPVAVVGFTVHFRNHSYWHANVHYGVSEPYKAEYATNKRIESGGFVAFRAWWRNMADYDYSDYGYMPSVYWFECWGNYYPSDNRADHTYTATWFLKTIYEDVLKCFQSGTTGLYGVAKDGFNHVDESYTYRNGYVAKAECMLNKAIDIAPVLYSEAFEDYYNADTDEKVFIDGVRLVVNGESTFQTGWYGIVLYCLAFSSNGSVEVKGGFTFIYHLSNGEQRKFEFYEDLYSGNVANAYLEEPQFTTVVNAGRYFALFNPSLGLLNIYDDVQENPFLLVNNVNGQVQSFSLQKEFDHDLKPIKTYSALTQW